MTRVARRRARFGRGIAGTAALVVIAGAAGVLTGRAMAATGCRVEYAANQWPGGFAATVAATNDGSPLHGWVLEWDFADAGQRVTQAWSAVAAQSGRHVTLRNAAWNADLGTGASASAGLQGTWSAGNPAPTAFTLNGSVCSGQGVGDGHGSSTPPPSSPSSPSSPGPSVTPSSAAESTAEREPHVDNPYLGGAGYVDPEWRANAESEPGGDRVSNTPTGLWLDRVAKIAGTGGRMGLRAHLDAALAQGARYVQVVLNDLPGRDCQRWGFTGDFPVDELSLYKTRFVDPIVAIESDPRYGRLRIVNVVEVDALPQLITQTSLFDVCNAAKANGGYVQGIQYALDRLHPYPNVYTYLSAAHHGWLGWDDPFLAAAQLFATVARGTTGGLASVDGFITNTANYAALAEPFFTATTLVAGVPARQSRWVDWNSYVGESAFARAFRDKLVALGFPPGTGMLIDTSRNGWGGPNRPARASTALDLNRFVDESRVDRRYTAGNWCNQVGAGLGERPVAAPEPGVDAYVWMKPPGESDGASAPAAAGDDRAFDRMCDPAYAGDFRNANQPSGAMPGAPAVGAWFPAQFRQLLANAYPPLP